MSVEMIAPKEADEIIRSHMPTYGATGIPITEATGRILRTAIRADRDLPPYNRITMDGVAIDFAAWQGGRRTFTLEATAVAGRPTPSLTQPATGCVQVMTGAMLPPGADTIIPYECIEMTDNTVQILDETSVVPLQHLHSEGSDRRAGEIILGPGIRLRGPHLSIAAAVGCARVQVSCPPSVAIVSTGDELKDVDEDVEPYQIRSSNEYGLRATLQQQGFSYIERFRVRDNPEATHHLLQTLLAEFDVLLLTGGVSMGKRDYVPQALAACSVECLFHKIRQKPGKPMWFGTSPTGKPVFALPGNSVSTLVCLHRYVLPALAYAQGENEAPAIWVRLQEAVRFPLPLTGYIPVRLTSSPAGVLSAAPCETNTSGDFAALADSDGFVEFPEGQDLFPAGAILQYRPWQ